MLTAKEVALYFIHIEPELYTNNIINRNNIDMYDGNVRLNKYLHLAQNVYIAKTGELLFDDPLYAYANGGVVQGIYKNYIPLKANANQIPSIPEEQRLFLDQIANSLRGASIDELIKMSHQDREWIEKTKASSQKMDSLERAAEYREQYKDIITIMELGLC